MSTLDQQLELAQLHLAAAITRRDHYITKADEQHWTETDTATGSGGQA